MEYVDGFQLAKAPDTDDGKRYIVRPCEDGYEVVDRQEAKRRGAAFTFRSYAQQYADELNDDYDNTPKVIR